LITGLIGCVSADIGIPNGPAEDGTLGLLKDHDSKNTKPGSPTRCQYGI
jgi:hypothetical protein